MDSKKIFDECQQLNELIHRKIDFLRFNYTLLSASSGYYQLLENGIKEDYSMGYREVLGYRASTAVPFYFYDLNNDLQTALKIFPIVAQEEGLRSYLNEKGFQKLLDLYEALPTRSAFHGVSFSNAILNPNEQNKSFSNQFINFLKSHARKE